MIKWKRLEEEVLALNEIEGGRVHSHIVAAGALYGRGAYGMFGELFKWAWAGASIGAETSERKVRREFDDDDLKRHTVKL